ncbi:rRNA maturation RNase YbeY [Martelella radicis]|uniref:Endoribonuclease YbeY n=1 Tax=Martelella radicis TaxID=1397476 RepID=A0A7W6KQ62_9HYPH|nr:rRNA maturation RNase YbeY [Martelella radicis]MBB4123923.1 putative rRNA maturation factor [Martelella radicis]
MPDFDYQVSREADGWPEDEALEAFAARVIGAASAYLAEAEGQPFPEDPPELSLVFADDAMIREINAEWRNKDSATNVLSFPAFPVTPGAMPGPMLGDIVIAYETVAREAETLEKSFDDHLTHLLVHGFLHLLGYDHIENEEAEVMEGLETRILATLDLSDPYQGSDPL